MAEPGYEETEDETYGIALGIRIVEEGGKFFLAEAEIAPYLDSPDELGVTLVFHPLDGLNPVDVNEEVDWPSWPIDIDDDLTLDTEAAMDDQFREIVRQLYELDKTRLKSYLTQARADAEE